MSVQIEKGIILKRLRSDHGYGITHEYSAPKIPQKNGIVERKNRIIQDMVRVMLNTKSLGHKWWAEAANTAVYLINRVYRRPLVEKTPYEI